MIQITKDDVVRSVQELVSERGRQYVNPRYLIAAGNAYDADKVTDVEAPYGQSYDGICRYVDPEGKPSCIVGSVLAKLGVSIDELKKHEGTSAGMLTRALTGEGIIGIDADAAYLLDDLQTVQDAGKPWGVVASSNYITV